LNVCCNPSLVKGHLVKVLCAAVAMALWRDSERLISQEGLDYSFLERALPVRCPLDPAPAQP
ncbi:hypothetical protein, partial [Synechococcus sp. R60.3]|uniref:hypothetical protein n=1 Tax=Synechococcus sp. R60.3 TaxID=2967123 RepID=UPI0039C46983